MKRHILSAVIISLLLTNIGLRLVKPPIQVSLDRSSDLLSVNMDRYAKSSWENGYLMAVKFAYEHPATSIQDHMEEVWTNSSVYLNMQNSH